MHNSFNYYTITNLTAGAKPDYLHVHCSESTLNITYLPDLTVSFNYTLLLLVTWGICFEYSPWTPSSLNSEKRGNMYL